MEELPPPLLEATDAAAAVLKTEQSAAAEMKAVSANADDIIHIDSRSHLEVADAKHRYAKNLRLYFREYDRLVGCTEITAAQQEQQSLRATNDASGEVPSSSGAITISSGSGSPDKEKSPRTSSSRWNRFEPFFRWLDNEEQLPELPECPRCVLDEDRVLYLNNESERSYFEVTITLQTTVDTGGDSGSSIPSDKSAVASEVKPAVVQPVRQEAIWRNAVTSESVTTGSKGWIFVLKNDRMYACEKRTSTFPRFHHSSFFAGRGVHAAGMIVCVNGRLTKLFPHSGHYRPHDRHLFSLLRYLRRKGVALEHVQVDGQRVMKQARHLERDGGKMKKTECALLLGGNTIFYFLRAKRRILDCGLLLQINALRSVGSALAETQSKPGQCVRQLVSSCEQETLPVLMMRQRQQQSRLEQYQQQQHQDQEMSHCENVIVSDLHHTPPTKGIAVGAERDSETSQLSIALPTSQVLMPQPMRNSIEFDGARNSGNPRRELVLHRMLVPSNHHEESQQHLVSVASLDENSVASRDLQEQSKFNKRVTATAHSEATHSSHAVASGRRLSATSSSGSLSEIFVARLSSTSGKSDNYNNNQQFVPPIGVAQTGGWVSRCSSRGSSKAPSSPPLTISTWMDFGSSSPIFPQQPGQYFDTDLRSLLAESPCIQQVGDYSKSVASSMKLCANTAGIRRRADSKDKQQSFVRSRQLSADGASPPKPSLTIPPFPAVPPSSDVAEYGDRLADEGHGQDRDLLKGISADNVTEDIDRLAFLSSANVIDPFPVRIQQPEFSNTKALSLLTCALQTQQEQIKMQVTDGDNTNGFNSPTKPPEFSDATLGDCIIPQSAGSPFQAPQSFATAVQEIHEGLSGHSSPTQISSLPPLTDGGRQISLETKESEQSRMISTVIVEARNKRNRREHDTVIDRDTTDEIGMTIAGEGLIRGQSPPSQASSLASSLSSEISIGFSDHCSSHSANTHASLGAPMAFHGGSLARSISTEQFLSPMRTKRSSHLLLWPMQRKFTTVTGIRRDRSRSTGDLSGYFHSKLRNPSQHREQHEHEIATQVMRASRSDASIESSARAVQSEIDASEAGFGTGNDAERTIASDEMDSEWGIFSNMELGNVNF